MRFRTGMATSSAGVFEPAACACGLCIRCVRCHCPFMGCGCSKRVKKSKFWRTVYPMTAIYKNLAVEIEVLNHVILGRATVERPEDFSSLRELGYFLAKHTQGVISNSSELRYCELDLSKLKRRLNCRPCPASSQPDSKISRKFSSSLRQMNSSPAPQPQSNFTAQNGMFCAA